MLKKFFQQPQFKVLARQLRQPTGSTGIRVGERMNKANALLYEQTLQAMNISTGDHLLEIGFGNGQFFGDILAKAPAVDITGIDYSSTMVNAAIKNNQTAIATGKLHLHQGSSDRMPFDSNAFNKIFCINVIYFWDKPEDHLRELRRVLKTGGTFFATIRTKESMQQLPFTKYGFHCYTNQEWEAVLNANGFDLQKIIPITEQPAVLNDQPFVIESSCLVAVKRD